VSTPTLERRAIVYPETEGQPRAENTRQFRWIVTIKEGLEALFRDDPNVFVAGDLFWYPVEGDNKTRTAPDTMVVFGRPKGDRGSYMQWEEDGVAPQVVFEVLSPGNRFSEMLRKFQFYETYGVDEYYIYDPDHNTPDGWLREGGRLHPIAEMNGWTSPRLGIRFEWDEAGLKLVRPDGRPLESYEELDLRARETEAKAQAERQRAEAADERAEAERRRAERLVEQLRALGIEPENDLRA
jgi:Uma2 family endonuclease